MFMIFLCDYFFILMCSVHTSLLSHFLGSSIYNLHFRERFSKNNNLLPNANQVNNDELGPHSIKSLGKCSNVLPHGSTSECELKINPIWGLRS